MAIHVYIKTYNYHELNTRSALPLATEGTQELS